MLMHLLFVPSLLSILDHFCALPEFQKRLIVVGGDAHRDPLCHYLLADCLGTAMFILLLTVTVVKNDFGRGRINERKVHSACICDTHLQVNF